MSCVRFGGKKFCGSRMKFGVNVAFAKWLAVGPDLRSNKALPTPARCRSASIPIRMINDNKTYGSHLPAGARYIIFTLTMNAKVSVGAFEIIQIDRRDSAVRQREVIHHIPRPSAQQATRFILQTNEHTNKGM